MSNNMLDRVCRECGTSFKGGPRAWYCPVCRRERVRQQSRDFRLRKNLGNVIPLGSLIKCVDCGKDIVKNGGLQARCAECQAKHFKELDNRQSMQWKKNHREKYLEAKRDFSNRRHKEDGKQSGITGVTWDKENRKWRVRWYNAETKEQEEVGYADDIESAKEMLEKYKK